MKKALSLILALVLCLSLSAVAFADGATNDVVAKKAYTVTGGNTVPAETLKFTVTADSSNPDASALITVDDVTIAADTATSDKTNIPITLPEYTKVGVYKYTISETAGNTQGVTYSTETVSVSVLVSYDEDGKVVVEQAGITKPASGDKQDTFTNTYDLGTLTVQKTVSGNLADKTKYFDIKVTLTAENTVLSAITVKGGSDSGNEQTIAANWKGDKVVTLKLKADETVTFSNIPAGVTYKVEEDAKHAAGDVNGEEGYTVTYTAQEGTIAKDTTSAAEVKNEKEASIDTGISLDSLPYILVLVGVVTVAGLLIARKRRVTD